MTRKRVKRRGSGDLKDATKEMLVISFLLGNGNMPSSASAIWSAWSPTSPEAIGTVASRTGKTLSLMGTMKICDRLVSDGILVQVSEPGYNQRIIKHYRLPIEGDKSYADGFLRVVARTRNSPFLLMDSAYGSAGIRKVLMAKVEKDLDIGLGRWKGVVAWAAAHSPTTLMLICDDRLDSGGIRDVSDEAGRMRRFLGAIGGAIAVDRASGYRGRSLGEDERTDEVDKLLAVGASSSGLEDPVLLARLKKLEVS